MTFALSFKTSEFIQTENLYFCYTVYTNILCINLYGQNLIDSALE